MKGSNTALEILCAAVVMVLLFMSLFGGFNLNSFVVVVMVIAVFAVLRDLRSHWQLKRGKTNPGTTIARQPDEVQGRPD